MKLLVALVAALASTAPAAPPEWALCVPCHGESGAGDGPAVDLLWPRPRDLRRDPLRLGADRVARSIREGVPGTAMPAFADLPPERIAALVAFIGRPETAPSTVEIPPPADDEAARGEALWAERCAACHGPDGAGDGPLAPGLRDADGQPADLYDLRRSPLKGGETLADVFETLTRGRPGTPMAAVESPADRRALAALVLRRRDPDPRPRLRLPPPGAKPRAVDRHWGIRPLPATPPTPGAIDPDPARCGVCHPRQHQTWATSRHAAAAGPGLLGQYHGADADFVLRCNACHAPEARQQGDPEATRQGVACGACHLRQHRKHGPPGPSSMRFPAPGMAPIVEPRFARADFCLPCHNLPLSVAVEGRPLLDTWREWAQSPFLPAGVQCQHCHQPGGAHAMPGVHDVEMVRRAVRFEVDAPRIADGRVALEARVRNVGAGHHFPTTATPRAVLRVRQLGPDGPLPDTAESWAIGRTVRHDGERWIEEADTRIPAGEVRARRYRRPLHPAAERIEASLHMFPDWLYTRFYRARLKTEVDPAARADFEAALAEAEASVILIDYRRLPLSAAPRPPRPAP